MNVFDVLILVCAVGSGLVAGVFFAFSTSVMNALGKIPAPCGIVAMQMINVVIINPLFLGVFIGTAVACAAVIVASFLQPDFAGIYWVLGGAVLYLGGSFFVTMRFNVPRNNLLARLDPTGPEAVAVWQEYLISWTAWNHVRTIASLAAAIVFMLHAF
jgi:uncharacterized membrane protein